MPRVLIAFASVLASRWLKERLSRWCWGDAVAVLAAKVADTMSLIANLIYLTLQSVA